MQGLKSAILAIFQNGLGCLCPFSPALNNPSQELKNYFCFVCRWISRKTEMQNWKVHTYSFMLKYSKIKVCFPTRSNKAEKLFQGYLNAGNTLNILSWKIFKYFTIQLQYHDHFFSITNFKHCQQHIGVTGSWFWHQNAEKTSQPKF